MGGQMNQPNDTSSIIPVLIITVAILVLLSQFGVPAFTERLQTMLVEAANQK